MKIFKDTNNKVHVVDAGFEYLLPQGCVEITQSEADDLTRIVATAPTLVSMRQARLALLQFGILAQCDAAIAVGTESDKITWEYATEVNRTDALVSNMAAAFNLTETDLDSLFTLAASL